MMKKKIIYTSVSVLAAAVLISVAIMGANELRLIENNANTLNINDTSQRNTSDIHDSEDFFQTSISQADIIYLTAVINDNIQEISTQLESGSYPPLVVQKDVAVKWTMTADRANLNYCNDEIIIPDFGIKKSLAEGANIIEFTASETGVIPYSCWMNMISSVIIVVDDINNYDAAEIETQITQLPQIDGSCSMGGGCKRCRGR